MEKVKTPLSSIAGTLTYSPLLDTRKVIFFVGLCMAVILLFLLELGIGAVHISVPEVINGLLGKAESDSTNKIIMELRLPRTLAAMLGGAALGAAGLHLQTLFRNPLAEPWSLGLMAGSQLGVALVVTTASVVGSSF